MQDELNRIEDLIRQGEKAQARKRLRPLLKTQPSARAWYLAAYAMDTRDQAIRCARNALKLDELHTGANRLLHQLEGEQPPEYGRSRTATEVPPLPPVEGRRRSAAQSQSGQSSRLWWVVKRAGCLFSLTGFLIGTWVFLNGLGLVLTSDVLCRLRLGPCPPTHIDGTPIAQVDDAVYRVQPDGTAQGLMRGEFTVGLLDPGVVHEYTFEAQAGEFLAVFVQFPPTLSNVPRNVGILDPDGYIAENTCQRDSLYDDDSGTILACAINRTGTWRVRIFGRQGETAGAYYLRIENFEPRIAQ